MNCVFHVNAYRISRGKQYIDQLIPNGHHVLRIKSSMHISMQEANALTIRAVSKIFQEGALVKIQLLQTHLPHTLLVLQSSINNRVQPGPDGVRIRSTPVPENLQ